jgi:CO/xanthine dehydrogenase FAD-binding subunit
VVNDVVFSKGFSYLDEHRERERMEYIRPKNVKEAVKAMKVWGNQAQLIAGGTNVVADLRDRAVRKEALIDISRIESLSYIKEEKQRIRIGASTTLAEIASSKIVLKHMPILAEAARQIGNPLVRNRGTIAGNLADASPAADMAPPLLVLGALVGIDNGSGRERRIPIDEFFLGPNRTVLKGAEMIREVVLPKPKATARGAYTKLGLRNSMAISVVSAAVMVEIEKGICKKVRVGFGAVSPTPVRAYGVEEILTGCEITEERIAECGEKIQSEIHPISDIRASREYRKAVAPILLGRLLRQVAGKKA